MRGVLLSIAQWLNQIHHGDCLEVMRQLPDASVDLVFTSPPYNIRTGCGGGRKTWEGYDGHADNMPHSRYVKWQRECLQEMMRLIPDTGAIFYNHCHRVQNGIMQSPLDILGGFPYRQAIIWERSGGINHNPGYFLPTHEMIYLIAKPDLGCWTAARERYGRFPRSALRGSLGCLPSRSHCPRRPSPRQTHGSCWTRSWVAAPQPRLPSLRAATILGSRRAKGTAGPHVNGWPFTFRARRSRYRRPAMSRYRRNPNHHQSERVPESFTTTSLRESMKRRAIASL